MSLYKHCNNCDAHQKLGGYVTPTHGDGWIKMDEPDYDFCSWRCVEQFAQKMTPDVKLPKVSR